MAEKTLYMVRGIPGSGKSTLARELSMLMRIKYFEADMFFDTPDGYQFNAEELYWAHNWCIRNVEREMSYGNSVIVSNTSTTEKEMRPYLDLVQDFGYSLVSVVVENRHGNSSVHDVPDDTIDKMKNRFVIKL